MTKELIEETLKYDGINGLFNLINDRLSEKYNEGYEEGYADGCCKRVCDNE